MIPKPLRKFMYDLLDATDEGGVDWTEGASNDVYICSHKSYNLYLSYFFDQEDAIGYFTFRISGKKDASFVVSSHESDDYAFMNNLSSSIQINASKLGDIASEFFA